MASSGTGLETTLEGVGTGAAEEIEVVGCSTGTYNLFPPRSVDTIGVSSWALQTRIKTMWRLGETGIKHT
jgi:hypothetical protein